MEITDATFAPFSERMEKVILQLREDFNTIRAGRANARVLDKISIEYYGAVTPVNQLANIQVPEARLITITPFDPTTLKAIEKAIQMSDLGINPSNDGKVIRLGFPPLTEERRRELTRTVAKHGEEARIAVRAVRRDAIEKVKGLEKKKEISADMLKDAEDRIQAVTDRYIGDIDRLIAEKDKELMAV